MSTTLPGVGTVVEDIAVTADASRRQGVFIGDRAGTSNDVIGPIDEAAPLSDAAPTSLNGRLQRVVNRLSTILTSTLATSIGDGQSVTLGARTDAKSAATDSTSVSVMSVLKQMSSALQTLAGQTAGTSLQTTATIGATSSQLVAASTFNNYARILVDSAQTSGIWINYVGLPATTAPPSEHLKPGDSVTWTRQGGFLPTTQWNAISDGSTVTVTVMGN